MLTRKLLWLGVAYGVYRFFKSGRAQQALNEMGEMSTDTTRQHI